MEQELRRLERALAESPADPEAARRLEAALLRADWRDEVRARYRFKFACPKRWAELAPTESPDVGHCGQCERKVHFVQDEAALAEHVAAGHCVAVEPFRLAHAIEGLIDHPLYHLAKEARATCVTEASRGEVFRPLAVPGGVGPIPG